MFPLVLQGIATYQLLRANCYAVAGQAALAAAYAALSGTVASKSSHIARISGYYDGWSSTCALRLCAFAAYQHRADERGVEAGIVARMIVCYPSPRLDRNE